MSTKDEIQGWIWAIQNKVNGYKQTVADCEKKIARLEPVYKELGEIKDSFRGARKSTEAIFEEKGTWRGEKHTTFCNDGAALDDMYGNYYRQLDAAQDAVNTKIGELKEKKQELIPIIGSLLAQIEQLWIDFSNAVN